VAYPGAATTLKDTFVVHIAIQSIFSLSCCLDIVAGMDGALSYTSYNVEATFDFVERIVRLVAFDSVVSTLLLMCMDGT